MMDPMIVTTSGLLSLIFSPSHTVDNDSSQLRWKSPTRKALTAMSRREAPRRFVRLDVVTRFEDDHAAPLARPPSISPNTAIERPSASNGYQSLAVPESTFAQGSVPFSCAPTAWPRPLCPCVRTYRGNDVVDDSTLLSLSSTHAFAPGGDDCEMRWYQAVVSPPPAIALPNSQGSIGR